MSNRTPDRCINPEWHAKVGHIGPCYSDYGSQPMPEVTGIDAELKRIDAYVAEMRKAQKMLLPMLVMNIAAAIEQVERWSSRPFALGSAETASEYCYKLAALVELFEAYDCEYGNSQPQYGQNLRERAEWLLKKYGDK